MITVLCHVNVLLANRICKEEVITDFKREVKKIKEVKMYTSRHPGVLQQIETFLLVKFPSCHLTLIVQMHKLSS